MNEDIVVPIAMLATALAIVAIIQYFRYRKNQDLQATIRAAIEKGQELPVEALEAINTKKEAPPKKDQDIRRGTALIGFGVGVGIYHFFLGKSGAPMFLLIAGTITLIIGMGLTVLWFLKTRSD